MTIQEAIDRVDILKPNHFTDEDKIGWLNTLDGQVWRELITTHEQPRRHGHHHGVRPEDFAADPLDGEKPHRHEHDWNAGRYHPYDNDTPRDTVLLVEEPYAEMYIHYMAAQIDLGNAEIGKYNNDKSLFNNAYLTYSDYYTRTHMPLTRIRHFTL